MTTTIPSLRVRSANAKESRKNGKFVLYWMTAFRRTRHNFALQYACELAAQFDKPLVILEALRVGYPWASDRFHRFIIQGMRDNATHCADTAALYYPYVEAKRGNGKGFLFELAEQACVVVTDDYPCFFHPRMIRAIASRIPSRLELVDGNCLMPLAYADRTFTVAHSYRRWMQKELPRHLQEMPEEDPLRSADLPRADGSVLQKSVRQRWPAADLAQLLDDGLSQLPIDHDVGPTATEGGSVAAGRALERFMADRLDGYDDARNEPDQAGSSELSPYLHFGHIATHEVFLRVMQVEDWNPGKLSKPNGKDQRLLGRPRGR